MKKVFFLGMLLCSFQIYAQTSPLNIVPVPVKVEVNNNSFTITPSTLLLVKDKNSSTSAAFLNDYLKKFYGFSLKIVPFAFKNYISLSRSTLAKPSDKPEGYTLNITNQSIDIAGDSYQGIFNGIQTLIQLLPVEKSNNLKIQGANIEDYPRFAYRGLMLDAGRHFFPVSFVKQFIDFIALHKMNTFHWHLTEDQGWRIEIKKYPKLTEIGACRNGTIIGRFPGKGNDNTKDCGFYTQEQIKDIIQYATDRFVTVIPEIELPGHSSAAIAAYPELSCFPDEPTKAPKGVTWSGPQTGKQVQQSWGVQSDVFCPTEYTFNFLQDVIDEVIQLFPSKYIHIGGDECPKDAWKKSAFCQNLIKEKGLKNEHELQSYFTQRIEKYINSKGRSIIGWDEILEGGLAPNATVMSWRGEQGGIDAAKQHHDVIMTPTTYVYFDYSQSKKEDSVTIGGYLPLEVVYNYNPIPAKLSPEEAVFIKGAQSNIWSEYMSNDKKVEYMIFPRLTALSEVLWSMPDHKNWDDFKNRLPLQFKRYDLWKVNYNAHGINKGE